MLVENFDWRNPDYLSVFRRRVSKLSLIREDPDRIVPPLLAYYRDKPWQMITDWGCTSDPRNVEVGLPAVVPFVLFPKQVEWCQWAYESWRKRRPGVTPKSRESGLSWLTVAFSVCMCILYDDLTIGFGSRLARYVDEIGAPKSLFWKARAFRELLPSELSGDYDPTRDAPSMRMQFRKTGSAMTGDAGDQIGRGDRTSIYFVDEAAFLEHPDLADAALSQTTNCRIDVSTPNGLGNSFARKVADWPAERVFRFHWRDDPRKDEAWYEKQKSELAPMILAQEVDIDFAASVDGVVIPSTWIQSAVDAHVKLGVHPTGARRASLDVADEGTDSCAIVGGYGFLIDSLAEWSGRGDDLFGTTTRAFDFCDANSCDELRFDGDGLGAGVRGDARVLNDQRRARGQSQIRVTQYRGSAAVADPTRSDVTGRKNEDYFANAKAQAWWNLRRLFENTHEAVTRGAKFDADEIISLSSRLPQLAKLQMELSQATYGMTTTGKMLINKKPDGARSPNLADAVVIQRARMKDPIRISDAALRLAARG